MLSFYLWGGMDGHGATSEPENTPSMLNAQKLSLTLVPAAQQAGAIKVLGGTQDGIYIHNLYQIDNWFILGTPDADNADPGANKGIYHPQDPEVFQWVIRDESGTPIYYSQDEVSLPQLVTWLNASDDTPASITVALATSSDMIDYGQSVSVSDGFYLNDSYEPDATGFYAEESAINGHRSYRQPNAATTDKVNHVSWLLSGENTFGTDGWTLYSSDLGTYYHSTENVTDPWLVVTWEVDQDQPSIVITHPATQVLAEPSTSQGAVFVVGGTQEGVYSRRGLLNGRPFFDILGTGTVGDGLNDDNQEFHWTNSGDGYLGFDAWILFGVDNQPSIYSTSDVATPDLATDWKNASDDSDAGITVTSVTQGELAAGLRVSNDGVTNGASYVSQPFHGRQYYMGLNGGGSNNLHWDTDFNVWTDDIGEWTTDNVAFPWQGADAHASHNGATFARNDVAAEVNWT